MNNPLFTDDEVETYSDSDNPQWDVGYEQGWEEACKEANRRCAEREKALIDKLKDKAFIMSILYDCVTVDEEERIKFICVEDVREKIDRLTQSHHNPNLIYNGGDMLKADEGYAVEPALNQVRQDEATSVTSNSPEEQVSEGSTPSATVPDNPAPEDTQSEVIE